MSSLLLLAALLQSAPPSAPPSAAPSAPPAAMAQRPRLRAPDERFEAMKRLSFLIGTWEGEGWMNFGPQSRSTFKSREKVEPRLDGLVLVVEGHHTGRLGADGPEAVVHHALGILSAAEDGRYAFQTWLVNGQTGSHQGEVRDGAFVWWSSGPRGTTRFTIRLDDKGRWHETGEHSRDGGTTWNKFFEMTLARVP